MSLQSLLNDTATLQRPTSTKDSSGGFTNSYVAVDSDVDCKVEDLSANDVMAYMKRDMIVSHNVTTFNANGRNGDAWYTSDSRLLIIQGVVKVRGQGGIDTYYEYVCNELRPGA